MRLRRWMANRRLRTKFVLILMAAMLLVFAITLATMRIPYAAYDQQLYNSSTQLITLFADRIQGELENIEALSFRMLADNVLQESLRDMLDKPITTSSWLEAKTNVGERISYFSVWFDSVLSLQIKTAGGTSLGQALGTAYTWERSPRRRWRRPRRKQAAPYGRWRTGTLPGSIWCGRYGRSNGSPCAPWPRC